MCHVRETGREGGSESTCPSNPRAGLENSAAFYIHICAYLSSTATKEGLRCRPVDSGTATALCCGVEGAELSTWIACELTSPPLPAAIGGSPSPNSRPPSPSPDPPGPSPLSSGPSPFPRPPAGGSLQPASWPLAPGKPLESCRLAGSWAPASRRTPLGSCGWSGSCPPGSPDGPACAASSSASRMEAPLGSAPSVRERKRLRVGEGEGAPLLSTSAERRMAGDGEDCGEPGSSMLEGVASVKSWRTASAEGVDAPLTSEHVRAGPAPWDPIFMIHGNRRTSYHFHALAAGGLDMIFMLSGNSRDLIHFNSRSRTHGSKPGRFRAAHLYLDISL
jgi:hypothetical protein